MYEKGHKVVPMVLQALNISVEMMEHLMTQVPGLVMESIKRLKAIPFDGERILLYTNTPHARVIRYLAQQAWPSADTLDSIPMLHIAADWTVFNLDIQDLSQPICILSSDAVMLHMTDQTLISPATCESVEDFVFRGGEERLASDLLPLYLDEAEFKLNHVYPIFDWTDQQVLAACCLYSLYIPEQWLLDRK